jgi:hypothetical protein
MATLSIPRDPTPGTRASPGRWTAFWRGFKTFVLARDRIDCQYAGWRQAYTCYFGFRSPHKARS